MLATFNSHFRRKLSWIASLFSPPKWESDDEDAEPIYKPINWSMVRRQLTWLAPFRKQYLAGLAVGLVHLILEMLGPKFMGHLIDYVTGYAKGAVNPLPRPVSGALEFVFGAFGRAVASTAPTASDATRHVVAVISFWALVLAASMLLQRLTILIMTWAGEQVQFNIRRRLFSHLQSLSMSYYDRTKLGRIISRCTSDVGAMREMNVWGIWQLVANATMVLVAACMLLYTDFHLFIAVAPLGPVIYLTNLIYKQRTMLLHQITREGWTRVSTNLAENITGMRVVMAFNRQLNNLAIFNTLQRKNTDNNVNVARANGVYQPVLQIIGFFGRVIILVYGGYLVASGTQNLSGGAITVGSVVQAYLYWDWFMNPIINFGNFYTSNLMPGMTGAERIFNLLDTRPDVTDVAGATPIGRLTGHVTFENVTFGYNPERPVLHDVTFAAAPGTTTALVGATGSGKSSIISLIARFYQPQVGRVLVDGTDIRYVTGESLHQQMGLVLQVNYLFTGTVLENIRYAKPDATEQDVIDAARALGTYDSIASLANGLHTEVGERGANMSLGQRQLICFTRAYLSDPRIFMLDEATSAVDTGTELLVQKSLEKLLKGRTTFIVAHRLSTIMKADQILVIDAGRIIERGKHRDLVRQGGKYAHLYHEFVKQAD